MPNIGPGELILILVIVLVIFGPGKLPDIGSAIGRGVREFRKASNELEDSLRGEPAQPPQQAQPPQPAQPPQQPAAPSDTSSTQGAPSAQTTDPK